METDKEKGINIKNTSPESSLDRKSREKEKEVRSKGIVN